jgi:serine/threonine protein kinase
LLKNPEQAEKHALQIEGDRQRVERKTKRKLAATKEYINQNRRELWTYLYHRELRREAMESSIVKDGLSPEAAAAVRSQHFEKESQYLRLRRVRTSLKEFTILARLGKGGYGQVYLCRKVDTGEILALKQMKKSRFTDKNEVHRVKKEREVMTKTNSIWLARLKYCFQSQHYLYMAMEYIPGGDLKTLLDHMTALDETDAKFLFAEMMLAVDALHQLGYIHRDLKPDNFMIDKNGHLKLIDFGLSKEGFSEKLNTSRSIKRRQSSFRVGAWKKNTLSILPQTKSRNKHRQVFSVVGSPEYMALEILNQDGYSNLVDYWSLGVILFEFIFGYTPFGADTVAGVFENVKNYRKRVVRPPRDEEDDDAEEVSDECWDLISRLITDVDNRIGKTGIAEVQNHEWFKGFDWSHIRDMEPPFIPNLESENDTSYFPAEEPMVQAGLAELEADLDHLISKQLARSTEGNSMEAVFDHRSGKHSVSKKQAQAQAAKPTPSDDISTISAQTAIQVNPPSSHVIPDAHPHSKPNSRHSSKGRRGSSRRGESPGPKAISAVGAATSSNDGSGSDMPPLSAPTPPPSSTTTATEHPKLKFNQSYSKFDFAGFTFKHEDFALLDSGSPRERERSNSTVELELPFFGSSSGPNGTSTTNGASSTDSPLPSPRDRSLTVREASNPKLPRGASGSPGSSPSQTDSVLNATGATPGVQSPRAGSGISVTNSSFPASGEPQNGSPPTTKASKDKISQILGPEVHSGSKLSRSQPAGSAASPAGSLASSSSSSGVMSPPSAIGQHVAHNAGSTPSKTASRVHGTSTPSTPGDRLQGDETMAMEHARTLGRTNTVQVLAPQEGFKPPRGFTHPSTGDSVRHADSTPASVLGRKSKTTATASPVGAGSSPEESLDSLKRRITRMKKQGSEQSDTEDYPGPSTGMGSNGTPMVASAVPPALTGSGHNSDSSSRGSTSDLEEGTDTGSGSVSKKKRKDGTLRKIQGLFEKLNFGKSSSSNAGTESTSSSQLIVVSTKSSSNRVTSPRGDRNLTESPRGGSGAASSTSGSTTSAGRNNTGAISSRVAGVNTTRNRSGTAGNEEAAGISSDSSKSSESRHRSEGRPGHRSRDRGSSGSKHRDGEEKGARAGLGSSHEMGGSVPSMMSKEAHSITSITSPTSKSKKRGSASSRSQHHHSAHPTGHSHLQGHDGHARAASSDLSARDHYASEPHQSIESLDPQARKERLLALARAFKESQGASSPAGGGGSAFTSPSHSASRDHPLAISPSGPHSALSSGKSSPTRASSPVRYRDDAGSNPSSEAGSRRNSEKRRRSGSGTPIPSRKPISSRRSSTIDPVEEASNEQTPTTTPEKVSARTISPTVSSIDQPSSKHERKPSKDRDGKDKVKKAKSATSSSSLEQEPSASGTPKKLKEHHHEKSSLKESKGKSKTSTDK